MVQSQYQTLQEHNLVQEFRSDRDHLLKKRDELISQRDRIRSLNDNLLARIVAATQRRRTPDIVHTVEPNRYNFSKPQFPQQYMVSS